MMRTICLLCLAAMISLAMSRGASEFLARSSQDLKKDQVAEKDDRKIVQGVVQEYALFSSAGDASAIEARTTLGHAPPNKRSNAPPASYEVEPLTPSASTVAPREGVWEQAELKYVRDEFPKFIRANKQRIVRVNSVIVKDNLAKVSVNIGDDQKYMLLPWVFLLTRENVEAKWKIFKITSPAYADEYL